jgi:hypothetical protein
VVVVDKEGGLVEVTGTDRVVEVLEIVRSSMLVKRV